MNTTLAVDVTGPVEEALGDVARFVPSLLLFVLILLAGWLLATLVRTGVDRLLERVGFDRLVQRGGVGRVLARTRYDASDLLAKLVYYAILLFTLQLAFGVWGPNPVSDLIGSVVAWIPKAAVAIIIVVVAAAIANAVKDLIGAALSGLTYGRLLSNVAYVFILGLGVIAALNQVGIATSVTTPVLIAVLATIAGILIVGVGGGLIRPMQQRWEVWLGRLSEEAPAVSERLRVAAEERRQRDAAAEALRRREAAEAEARRRREEAEAEARRQREADAAQMTEPAAPTLAEAPTMVVPVARPAPPQPAATPPRQAPAAADDTAIINRPAMDDTAIINPPPSREGPQ